MLPLGALIWVSIRPLLRLVLCTGFGFFITKADIFPVVASRGAGQVIINIFTPCLMFSKIVPAFSIENIGTLGPLFLLAFIYEGMGLLQAWIIKQFFWVPHRFRYGILAAGTWGNYGDIPTSVVMSITAGPPFNSTSDQTLAVAYVSAFIFVFFLTLFPMSGNRMIAWDFIGPEVEDEEMRETIRIKRDVALHFWKHIPTTLRRRHRKDDDSPSYSDETEKVYDKTGQTHFDEESAVQTRPATAAESGDFDIHEDGQTTAVPSEAVITSTRKGSAAPTDYFRSRATSPTPTVTHADTATHVDQQSPADSVPSKNVRFDEKTTSSLISGLSRRRRIMRRVHDFVVSLASPPSLSIIIAFPVALITPVKGLFVPLPNSPIPNAPDGQPPLAFIMDTATFVGAASVPMGLICLGSALARLKVPMNVPSWKAMPVGAISALAIAKIVISPILGVLICEGLTNAGIINRDDKVLRFVCIFFSCLPTATSQVYLTQVYSSTGTAEHVPAFLLPQYILLVFIMTILTAYSLHIIF